MFLHLSLILFTEGGGRVWGEGVGMYGRRDGHCGGRYASYWNAFFLLFNCDLLSI